MILNPRGMRSLTGADGEHTAQTCAIAWLRQLPLHPLTESARIKFCLYNYGARPPAASESMLQMSAAERYTAAWRERRRRMYAFRATQLAFFPILLVAVYVSSRCPRPITDKVFLSGFAVWFVAYIIVDFWLNRFRCPRCGNLYYWRVQLKGASERQRKWRNCHHCGLSQDASPRQRTHPRQSAVTHD